MGAAARRLGATIALAALGCSFEHFGVPVPADSRPTDGAVADAGQDGPLADGSLDGATDAALDAATDAALSDARPSDAAPADAPPADACAPELCNGLDDDCDGFIDEDFPLGVMCDGLDTDLCAEGVVVCDGAGGTTCSDATGDSVETCDGTDEDCDTIVDNGFDLGMDEANCGACGTVCVPSNGTNDCVAGVCSPSCNPGAQDCNGSVLDGCELRDTNPLCADRTHLGDVSGDTASTALTASGYGEVWYRVGVIENNDFTLEEVTVQVDLVSPAGVNFDLHVTCAACGDTRTLSSTNPAGMTDTVVLGRDDMAFVDVGFFAFIEVRFAGATACGDWSLTVTGDVSTSNRTCN